MLEIGIVCGVSDAGLLRKACSEYFAVGQEMLDKLHKAVPNEFPEIKLSKPKMQRISGGTVYSYRLPAKLGCPFSS